MVDLILLICFHCPFPALSVLSVGNSNSYILCRACWTHLWIGKFAYGRLLFKYIKWNWYLQHSWAPWCLCWDMLFQFPSHDSFIGLLLFLYAFFFGKLVFSILCKLLGLLSVPCHDEFVWDNMRINIFYFP